MKEGLILRKFITSLVAGVTVSALLLTLGNSGNISWFPPVIVFPLVGIVLVLALVFPFIWQRKEGTNPQFSKKTYAFLYALIRYCIAFNIACFGWKKVFGLQFIVPPEISAMPMNQQSGEWLTWYYYGYSAAFGLIVALLQIVGAGLLLFRKTLLAGLIILFPLMLNIALVDIFYKMNMGALLQALVITTGLMFLLLLHYKLLL
ncbi:MAG TPA: hypothetical protein VF610_11740, partial [Segetibacter sp.]